MTFMNWCFHLDNLKSFRNSEIFEICCRDDNIVTNLFYGYVSTIGDELAGQEICDIYYGENSNFWLDYLIEDFITFGYALVPVIVKDNRDIPEIESELDYSHGIRLETEEELYKFITNGILPSKEQEYISPDWAIRRSVNLN